MSTKDEVYNAEARAWDDPGGQPAGVGGVRRGNLLYVEQDFIKRYYHDDNEFQTFGASLELQAFTNIFQIYGTGLYGYVNLNFVKSFAGFCLIVQVGKF